MQRFESIHRLRREGGLIRIRDEWSLIEVVGEDSIEFLHNQLTVSIKDLGEMQMKLASRLNRTGQVASFFYVGRATKEKHAVFIWAPSELVDNIVSDLEKYIIMEDVELQKSKAEVTLAFGLEAIKRESGVELSFYGVPAKLYFELEAKEDCVVGDLLDQRLEALRVLNGFPKWGEGIDEKTLLNETTLNQYAVDYSKGCFLGQETVSKIQNNRGAANYPVLIKTSESSLNFDLGSKIYNQEKKMGTILNFTEIDGNLFLLTKLARQERVHGVELEFSLDQENFYKGEVLYLPFYKADNWPALSDELYETGAHKFRDGLESEAIKDLLAAIEFNPKNAEAYESLGVIYGRHEKYDEAIELMEKLEQINPKSVMAHTNKSLYLMKLDRIEEAEEEKAQATLKSFSMYGDEAKNKKAQEEARERERQEIEGREKMFLEVLGIDPEDEIANYGLADIAFKRKEYDKAVKYLEIVLKKNPRYSTAYVLLGKAYETKGLKEKAIKVYKEGIEVSKKRGDLMPANEMQSRLSQL